MTDSMRRPTALLIPSPWSGDENDPPTRTYWMWFRLYRTVRTLRHRVGLHDWHLVMTGDGMERCDWCGSRRRTAA